MSIFENFPPTYEIHALSNCINDSVVFIHVLEFILFLNHFGE